jgi:uncharacterized protein (TIGR02466 family)
MSKIEMWFPVAVYSEEELLTKEDNEALKTHCLSVKDIIPSGGSEWLGGTYNTHGTYDVSTDKKFQPLLDSISYHVHQFAKMHNCYELYKSEYAWMNIAKSSDWQEFHTHNGNVFSAVYYVAVPEGSGQIVFEDPKEPDMCPLKTKTNRNQLSYTRIGYTPVEGSLIIFRSYLRHCVEPGHNTDPRISIALNFN